MNISNVPEKLVPYFGLSYKFHHKELQFPESEKMNA